ncbi:hypothetical protein DUNSADRAFT_12673 [Dunaliella salina]|uniref:Uncharacterized protein n=1 Tax=Dunaliella salina TaxID=3046 RepID=A0ABQ7GAT9_DUNSA|nr:hypothetical protein DUNSADRAFT_12673 [Dunaliella salina]|eukprot:KAF5831726.1 hypothetical protein DUNSADRAFT_12673 [Dunaliella salina]
MSAWCPGYGSSGSSDANVLFSISSGQQLRLPPQLSPVCSDLLSAMLHRDPAHRATASQLLAHPFITQQAPALAPAGTLVRREAGGHAPAHHKVSPFKQAHGQLPPRPPPHRP